MASRCGLSYKDALALFSRPEHAWSRGYFCQEIVEALARAGFRYAFASYDRARHLPLLELPGTIVFHASSKDFPVGHYVLRARRGRLGWMNPWSNFPQMVPVESDFQEAIDSNPAYVIFEWQSAAISRVFEAFSGEIKK